MAGLLEGVDKRTNLVGENRLELLLFRLGGKQRYGINVFKVQEVIHCPSLTRMAHSNPMVCGITHLRGRTISIIDLARAIGKGSIANIKDGFVIVTEYNRTVQGFLVTGVERIVNLNWEEIKAPPKGLGKENFMTAVTTVDNDLVEIIDVEKILADLIGSGVEVHDRGAVNSVAGRPIRILVVDDSSVARNQIKRTLDQLGMDVILANNGREGLDKLKAMAAEGPIGEQIDAVISDVEMPEMDGYTFTQEIKRDASLSDLPVLLHTSLSGTFNKSMVEKVGAERFVPKFNAEDLTREVREMLQNKGLI